MALVDANGNPVNTPAEEIQVPEIESGLSENPEAEVSEPALPREIDPEVLAQLERNLEAFKSEQGATASGSEAVAGPNLDDFEFDPALEHLYRRGRVEDVDDVPTWVTPEHQYLIIGGNYGGERGKRNKGNVLMRLDDQIQEITNGPEGIMSIANHGWRLSAVIPNGTGMGVAILERNIKRPLPWPDAVKKETEVAAVKDEELQRMNETAQAWAAEQQSQDAGEAATETPDA